MDKELGKDEVKDVLGDYFEEVESVVQGLICDNPGLTRSESVEAMEVDPQIEPTAKTQDQPMETEQLGSSPGTFRPELTELGYNLSLIGSTIHLHLQLQPKITPFWMLLTQKLQVRTYPRFQVPANQRDHLNPGRLSGKGSSPSFSNWE